MTSAQVAAFDPQGVGFNSALASLLASRYPHANDLSGAAGDLINTAGFRFNAPFPYKEDDYVQRVDFNLNDRMKLWGKGNFTRTNGTQSSIWFPGDPETSPFLDQSYTWVVGHVWTISNTKVNQASYGEVFENFNFPNIYNPDRRHAIRPRWRERHGRRYYLWPLRAVPLTHKAEPIPSR